MKFVAFVMIVIIGWVAASPQPHKLGFGVPALAVAEPVVPVPVVVQKVVPIVQPVVQPIVPVVQSYYPIVPIVGRFGHFRKFGKFF